MDPETSRQADFVGQIARHQAGLHAYVISLMPGMDGVDDVLQETNLVLWEKRETFRLGSDFRAWACAIARFKVLSHRRKLAKLGVRLLDHDLVEMLSQECGAGVDEMNERLRALEKCLGRLDEEERGLVEHRYYSGSTLENFAVECQRPVESLRVSLFRIRAALKKCINSELVINRSRS